MHIEREIYLRIVSYTYPIGKISIWTLIYHLKHSLLIIPQSAGIRIMRNSVSESYGSLSN
jgi:hypothetical protein